MDCVDVVTGFLVTTYSMVVGKSSSNPDVDSETDSMISTFHSSVISSSSSSDEVLGPSVSSRMELVVLGNVIPWLRLSEFRVVVYLQGVEVLLGLEVEMWVMSGVVWRW